MATITWGSTGTHATLAAAVASYAWTEDVTFQQSGTSTELVSISWNQYAMNGYTATVKGDGSLSTHLFISVVQLLTNVTLKGEVIYDGLTYTTTGNLLVINSGLPSSFPVTIKNMIGTCSQDVVWLKTQVPSVVKMWNCDIVIPGNQDVMEVTAAGTAQTMYMEDCMFYSQGAPQHLFNCPFSPVLVFLKRIYVRGTASVNFANTPVNWDVNNFKAEVFTTDTTTNVDNDQIPFDLTEFQSVTPGEELYGVPLSGSVLTTLASQDTNIPENTTGLNGVEVGVRAAGPYTPPVTGDGLTNQIEQGAVSIDVHTLAQYTVKIELSMDGATDSRGYMQWRDNTSVYDNYSNSFTVETTDGAGLETLLTIDSEDTVNITTPLENGFYPFGMGFATEQDYPVNITRNYDGKDFDFFGKTRTYKLRAVPAVTDIYSSLDASGVIPDCGISLNHWQIGSVYFPFGSWKPTANNAKKVIVAGGSSSEIVDTTRTYGDRAKIKVKCSENQARLILQFLTLTMRGTEQTATMPAAYNMFGRRPESLTTATVKLYSNIITVTAKKAADVNIEFELQMVGL